MSNNKTDTNYNEPQLPINQADVADIFAPSDIVNTYVHELIIRQAQSTPDAIAIVTNKRNYTYTELLKRARIISDYINSYNIPDNSIIGLMTERSFDMVASILAIHMSGNAYLPLDPGFPKERLEYMIQDSNTPIIITQSIFSKFIDKSYSIKIILIDKISTWLTSGKKTVKTHNASEPLAYCIYTSGSTGKPKGVRILHSSLLNFLLSMQKEPGITSSDSILAITTLSFDISILEILLPLTVGAKTILASKDISLNGFLLADLISSSKATIFQATPSTWHLLLSASWSGSRNIKALCGGEKLPAELAKSLIPLVKELWNMYGPTETTIWSTCQKVSTPDTSLLIGKPIANTRLYILDSDMKPVLKNCIGELYIAGSGLAGGYQNRPELTDKFFLKNHSLPHESTIYRTGDLVRLTDNGNIEYIGRTDTQIKIRGFRIELGEIETVVSKHPDIRQCVAHCKEYTSEDFRLILFYTLKSINSDPDLKHFLQKYLPDYMIPQHFVKLDDMPLTLSGKINRIALPQLVDSKSSHLSDRSLPVTENETYLADIWKNVLGLSDVHLTDNFYELGGHSLLTVKLLSQIKKDTNIDIDPKTIMLNTLEQIAAIYPLKSSDSHIKKQPHKIFSRVIGKFFRQKK